ncbi:MAG: hypothetical protein GY719_32750 [bacterium]|nr:hypothetical protein [bacterium]
MTSEPTTSTRPSAAGLRGSLAGIVAIAATYVYFLLFAQFAFLDLLQERLGSAPAVERAMAAMGLTGLCASLGVAVVLKTRRSRRWLAAGFAACAATAVAAPAVSGTWATMTMAALIGFFTAVLTVALATGLRDLVRGRWYGLAVGLGTGLAYLVCNVPPIFEGTAALRGAVAALACLAGLAAVLIPSSGSAPSSPVVPTRALTQRDYQGLGFVSLILSFLALIWLDSAAFAVIQETMALKGSTWGTAPQKLAIGVTHFLAAVAAGWLIDRGFFRSLLIAAFCLFSVSFTVLGAQDLLGEAGLLILTGPIYAVGISLYSVALVAYPAYRRDEVGLVPRRWRAGIVYGVAGWLGSALGVGMAQNLHHIPRPFLWITGLLLVAGWALARNGRLAAAVKAHAVTLACGAAGVAVYAVLPAVAATSAAGGPELSTVTRGRRVYIQEGCINCHSQYVRPRTDDVEYWGPHRPPDPGDQPPLYGNRRQGPDLTNVGLRRDHKWQRLHLIEPRRVSPASRMPSYGYLFADGETRGDDLVAYLDSLGSSAPRLASTIPPAIAPGSEVEDR